MLELNLAAALSLAAPDNRISILAAVDAPHGPPPPILADIAPIDGDASNTPVPGIDFDAVEAERDTLADRLRKALFDRPERRQELGFDAAPRAREVEALGARELGSARTTA